MFFEHHAASTDILEFRNFDTGIILVDNLRDFADKPFFNYSEKTDVRANNT